ncbi:hypothetical protein M8037_31930 [Sinorhizobium meliloti]|uniref:hypothetical protein n=1 Tax=Rhizobium meliloti TaxID=382 RepID=UPI0020745578|nr:hypothetical protein [Sinorhizobium meliloti]MCM5693274.1 hypothetical protein [Sinorhizobium meliloti]
MTPTPALTKHLNKPERFVDLASGPGARAAKLRNRFPVFNHSTGDLLATILDMSTENVSAPVDPLAQRRSCSDTDGRDRKALAEAKSEALHAAPTGLLSNIHTRFHYRIHPMLNSLSGSAAVLRM